MAKVWKITACEEQMVGGSPPRKEYFLVAMPDQFAAMASLRKRPTLRDADLTVVGEASPDDIEWLDAKDGEIFCVMPIFMTRSDKRSPAPAQASAEVEDRQSARQKRTPKRQSQRRKSTRIKSR
jgi:hypothetical protein